MAQLAINGHATRCKEVIEILEMLGGKNIHNLTGDKTMGYYVNENKEIKGGLAIFGDESYIFLTLEEFLEKFPYKVGDKVKVCGDNLGVIIGMRWEIDYVVYKVKLSKNGYETNKTSDNLQPYKEETMEENTDTAFAIDLKLKGEDYSDRRFCYKIPNGYKIDCVRENEIILKPIKPQYPKTYEECCDVLKIPNDERYIDIDVPLDYNKLLSAFTELIICRNAYWKIAGDWKEKRKGKAMHYVIHSTLLGEVIKDTMPNCIANYLLDFPTEEMRDAFKENFDGDIDVCKEFL